MTDDQHDTVVLRHETIALPRPGQAAGDQAPAGPAGPAAPTPPDPGATGGAGTGPASAWRRIPGPTGWQPVADWRGTVYHHAPTAWSHVPPFIPPASPPILVMRNNAAVIGATLGSVSLFLALLPLIGIVSWLLAPIGLVSSGIGLFVGMARKVGRVGAVWGLLTSGLALLVCMAWTALILAL